MRVNWPGATLYYVVGDVYVAAGTSVGSRGLWTGVGYGTAPPRCNSLQRKEYVDDCLWSWIKAV